MSYDRKILGIYVLKPPNNITFFFLNLSAGFKLFMTFVPLFVF